MTQSKFLLIDGNSLLYRAFYALPLLHTREGIYTNGIYGFLTMFNRVKAEQKPTHLLVAFDKDKQTFRNSLFNEYKANRLSAPDELIDQFTFLREILTAMNVDFLEEQGYEADDIIGTISRQTEENDIPTIILTGDKDTLQLVSEQVTVMMTKKGITEMETYDSQAVINRYGVTPDRLIEIKALMGDASDNIPGVPGIGEKTAIKLIGEYGSLENLYEHIDQITGKKLVERLSENEAQAYLSRDLSRIVRDMEVNCDLEDFRVKEPDYAQLKELYRRLEFNSFLASLQESETLEQQAEEVILPVVDINSAEQIAGIVDSLSAEQDLAVVIEADYHHPMWAKLQEIYLYNGQTVYRAALQENSAGQLDILRPLLESANTPKIFHNAKFAQVILKRYGIELHGIKGDTLLAAYIKDPAFEGELLHETMQKHLNINATPANHALLVSKLPELYTHLINSISPDQTHLLDEVEMPLSTVLANMEFCGVRVQRDTLVTIAEELSAGIKHSEENIFGLAGQSFNINSPKQLGKVLFEDLGLRVIKKTKTGYATGAEVLEELCDDHPIITYILTYRQLTKLKSTYADALQDLIHPDTGRVHTIFKQAQTATGRLSSVEPNLQNIPVKMEEGRRIRKAFTAPADDWYLLSADYSQIDLRALAHISGDKTLIETFHQGIDIHARTASEIFHVSLEEVNEDLRRRAKAVNFGIIYGISDFGLSRDTGVSRKEARQYIDNYLASYPGVKQYMEDIVEFGMRNGYVETILKRRRYLPDLNARNKMVQSFARRMALNTPIQGSSADIIKLAMIDIYNELQARNLRSRMLLQVHDDLVLEVPREELDLVMGILKDKMENACTLKVPLEVCLKVGSNWYDMQEI